VSIANGATPWTYTAAGQHITYAYTLTNDRNTRLTGLTVADSRLGDITRDCRKPASPSVPTWTVGQLHHHTDRRGQRQHHEQAGDERELPVRKAFSKAQRSLFGGQAPAGMELDDLVVLGPLNILKLKFAHQDYSRPMVVELWFYPDGSQILELSAKCRPDQSFAAAAETKSFLARHGVDLGAPQMTKTKTAMSFFASELAARSTATA
jgi:hypothetical protein